MVRMSRASERARAEILSAAVSLFSAAGYAGTSLADIARRAGCSKATVLYHFHNKDSILSDLLAPGLASLQELGAAIDAAPAEDAQRVAIEGFVELAVRHRAEIAILHDDLPRLFTSPTFAEVQGTIERLRHAMAGSLDRAGSADPGAEVSAWMAMAGTSAACVQSPDLPDDELHEALRAALTRLLT